MKMNLVDYLAILLVAIGGINWGLIGVFDYNLVETLLGDSIATIIYTIVGLSALYVLIALFIKTDNRQLIRD